MVPCPLWIRHWSPPGHRKLRISTRLQGKSPRAGGNREGVGGGGAGDTSPPSLTAPPPIAPTPPMPIAEPTPAGCEPATAALRSGAVPATQEPSDPLLFVILSTCSRSMLCRFTRCLLMLPDVENCSPQMGHVVWPWCFFMWETRLQRWAYLAPHRWHECGPSVETDPV